MISLKFRIFRNHTKFCIFRIQVRKKPYKLFGSNSEGFRTCANGKFDSDRKLTKVAIISCIPELDFERLAFLSFSIIILEFHKDEHQRVCRKPDVNTIDHFIYSSYWYEYNGEYKMGIGGGSVSSGLDCKQCWNSDLIEFDFRMFCLV